MQIRKDPWYQWEGKVLLVWWQMHVLNTQQVECQGTLYTSRKPVCARRSWDTQISSLGDNLGQRETTASFLSCWGHPALSRRQHGSLSVDRTPLLICVIVGVRWKTEVWLTPTLLRSLCVLIIFHLTENNISALKKSVLSLWWWWGSMKLTSHPQLFSCVVCASVEGSSTERGDTVTSLNLVRDSSIRVLWFWLKSMLWPMERYLWKSISQLMD